MTDEQPIQNMIMSNDEIIFLNKLKIIVFITNEQPIQNMIMSNDEIIFK